MQKTHYYKSVIPGFSLDEVFIGSYYDAEMQQKIHRFKFVHNRVDRVYFESLFAHMQKEFPAIWTVIVYPPVSMKDRILRGPNHARYLAEYFLSACRFSSDSAHPEYPHNPLDLSTPLKGGLATNSDSVNDAVSKSPFQGGADAGGGGMVTEVARSAGGIVSKDIICPFSKKFFADHQSRRSKKERETIQEEILWNEKYTEKVQGKDIILIDDLITTGYTAHTLGKLLKQAGAKSVVGYFLASEKI